MYFGFSGTTYSVYLNSSLPVTFSTLELFENNCDCGGQKRLKKWAEKRSLTHPVAKFSPTANLPNYKQCLSRILRVDTGLILSAMPKMSDPQQWTGEAHNTSSRNLLLIGIQLHFHVEWYAITHRNGDREMLITRRRYDNAIEISFVGRVIYHVLRLL